MLRCPSTGVVAGVDQRALREGTELADFGLHDVDLADHAGKTSKASLAHRYKGHDVGPPAQRAINHPDGFIYVGHIGQHLHPQIQSGGGKGQAADAFSLKPQQHVGAPEIALHAKGRQPKTRGTLRHRRIAGRGLSFRPGKARGHKAGFPATG